VAFRSLLGFGKAGTVWLVLFAASVLMNAQSPRQVWFEVPNGLKEVEGNEGTLIPFSDVRPVRYQQVYDAADFSRVPAGGAFISRILLRPDCGNTRGFLSTNLQLNLSTTAKGPDQLSALFAENAGADETVVWRRDSYSPPVGGEPPCPAGFSSGGTFYLDVPFFYDPAKGNLLLDLRKGGTIHIAGRLESSQADAQNVLGDATSRAVAFSLAATTAEIVDSVGLVTAFEFFPTPTLEARYETNHVELSWFWTTQEDTFRLQWADRLDAEQAWSHYPGDVEQLAWTYRATIPAGSLGHRKFFRLFWDTPQPLAVPAITAPVALDRITNP
jgi:hypothetical protein